MLSVCVLYIKKYNFFKISIVFSKYPTFFILETNMLFPWEQRLKHLQDLQISKNIAEDLLLYMNQSVHKYTFPQQQTPEKHVPYWEEFLKNNPPEKISFFLGIKVKDFNDIQIHIQQHLAGSLPVIATKNRTDFIHIISQCIPNISIGNNINAFMIPKYKNLSREKYFKNNTKNPWNLEKQKILYLEPWKLIDRFIVIHQTFYSNVSLPISQWLQKSYNIRLEHEFTHYLFYRLYKTSITHLYIELLCDWSAILKTFGFFSAQMQKQFFFTCSCSPEQVCPEQHWPQSSFSPEQVCPEQHFPQSSFSPEQVCPEQHFPQSSFSPEQVCPEQHFPQSSFSPEQVCPEQVCPEQVCPEQYFPQSSFSPEQVCPEQYFPQSSFSPEQVCPEQYFPQSSFSPEQYFPQSNINPKAVSSQNSFSLEQICLHNDSRFFYYTKQFSQEVRYALYSLFQKAIENLEILTNKYYTNENHYIFLLTLATIPLDVLANERILLFFSNVLMENERYEI